MGGRTGGVTQIREWKLPAAHPGATCLACRSQPGKRGSKPFPSDSEVLRIAWTARRSNQSILKEINPKYLLEGLMLKQKLQYSGHLIQRATSLEKTLMLGKIEGRRIRGRQRMRWLEGITNSMDELEPTPGDGEGQGNLACCSLWGCKQLDTIGQMNNRAFHLGRVEQLAWGSVHNYSEMLPCVPPASH